MFLPRIFKNRLDGGILVKSVVELLGERNYDRVAERYFEWLAAKLGNGDYETGLHDLARRYNGWVLARRPFTIPPKFEVAPWLAKNGALNATEDTIREINRSFDDVLKSRIEEALHHSNPLNP